MRTAISPRFAIRSRRIATISAGASRGTRRCLPVPRRWRARAAIRSGRSASVERRGRLAHEPLVRGDGLGSARRGSAATTSSTVASSSLGRHDVDARARYVAASSASNTRPVVNSSRARPGPIAADTYGAIVRRQQPEPHLGEREAGAVDGDGHVGARDEAGAAADRGPFTRATTAFGHGRARRTPPPSPRRRPGSRSSESSRLAAHPREVGAGRERAAGAGQHDDPDDRRRLRRRSTASASAASRPGSSALRRSGPVERQRSRPAPRGQPDVAHIRNTPKVVGSIGAREAASRPSASTLRVSSGSITPSSQRRAVEWYGLPSCS